MTAYGDKGRHTNGIQPVRDAEQCRRCELRLNCTLQLGIRFDINTACRLVQNDDSAILDEGTSQGEKLLFSSAKVGPCTDD